MSNPRKYYLEDDHFSELDPNLLNTSLVYFLKLPNGFIKVGKSEYNHNFHLRQEAAKRKYGSDVEPLDIELCESNDEAHHKETQLIKKFGYKDELLYDTPELRAYIEKHCMGDIAYDVAMCHAAERVRNRDRYSRKG